MLRETAVALPEISGLPAASRVREYEDARMKAWEIGGANGDLRLLKPRSGKYRVSVPRQGILCRVYCRPISGDSRSE